MDVEHKNEPVVSEEPVSESVGELDAVMAEDQPEEKPGQKFVVSKKMMPVVITLGIMLAVFAIMTSFVYRHSPTDSSVRKIVNVIPYPAELIGNHFITLKELADERDMMSTYLQVSGVLDENGGQDDRTIDENLLNTIEQRFIISQIAASRNVVADAGKVDEFYVDSMAGSDPELFANQITATFGWTTDEFRTRVIEPVVLATLTNESIAQDAERQAEPKRKAQAAYDRLVAGEDFAAVAGETSGHPSAASGGDVGELLALDVPEEFREVIAALEVGAYSTVFDGKTSFMIFKLTSRSGTGQEEKLGISLISIQKITLTELVEEYKLLHRNWRFIPKA